MVRQLFHIFQLSLYIYYIELINSYPLNTKTFEICDNLLKTGSAVLPLVLVDTFLGLDRTLLKSSDKPLVQIWEMSRPNNWKKGITIQKRTVHTLALLRGVLQIQKHLVLKRLRN
jgi:hypothetical protein